MLSSFLILGSAAFAAAQVPPAPVLLTVTKSGVLPYLPTNFVGVETLEGAIIDDGPVNTTVTGMYGNATVQQNNAGISYMATLPSTNFDPLTGSIITGTITATVPKNGTGVQITVAFSGFPEGYGPFGYHIHGTPVPADGNCTATLGHLDTTNRGEYYPCNAAQPETCQTGDLSGKHGKIGASTTNFKANYSEAYISTNPDNSYFGFGGSIVIHSSNTTRLTCANWTFISGGTSNYTNASISSAVASIASSLSSVNAIATASPNATSATTTKTSSTTAKSSSTGGVVASGSTSAGASSTGASTTGTAASTAASATYTASAIKNVAGAVLGGVAFIIGAVAL